MSFLAHIEGSAASVAAGGGALAFGTGAVAAGGEAAGGPEAGFAGEALDGEAVGAGVAGGVGDGAAWAFCSFSRASIAAICWHSWRFPKTG